MLNVTIKAEGKTLSDLLDAVGEAVTRLDNEFTSGHDRNESSNFSFERDGEEEIDRTAVRIYGPNINFPDGVTFHVHAEGCAHITRRPYSHVTPGRDQGGQVEHHATALDVITSIYPPGDFEYDETDEAELEPYAADVHIFPCTGLS